MEYNEEGIIKLRDAIVEQAAKDYIAIKKYILRHFNKPCTEKKWELENITRWFRSSNFDDMKTGCSGDYFIKKLDEMVEDDMQVARKRVENGRKKTNIRVGFNKKGER